MDFDSILEVTKSRNHQHHWFVIKHILKFYRCLHITYNKTYTIWGVSLLPHPCPTIKGDDVLLLIGTN